MSDTCFLQYTTEYISGVMSLRTPQENSLKILDSIMSGVDLSKQRGIEEKLSEINAMYPICTDFERNFPSLTFALATGVGKTRLMGAFITYLYTAQSIRNFFVVAPGTTIYDKLQKDLGDPSSPKYVFKGVGCFLNPPNIVTDDDYRDKNLYLWESDINIYIYNIDKFNKEDAKMKDVTENLGKSFYDAISSLNDLVLIMDESHHYRAARGMAALDNLHPMLGLELTATPLWKKGTKQIPFKNVVYEYPLSKAIADGYTRTPFAITRADIDFYSFGDEQLDKLMILDGITCHENAKRKLEMYAEETGRKIVKPFMLIVCQDTAHAQWVESFVKSDEFREGKYRNKIIIVHSKMRGGESEFNMRLLLDVERNDNPIEIVIHVNMLKEGWDVNNLYTIVPLRTAASKVLREQMVGRGLRLPYGERTNNPDVDSVMLTAHDKFQDILEEARKGDSIFRAGNVIHVEDIGKEKNIYTQVELQLEDDKHERDYEETGITRSIQTDELFEKVKEDIAQELVHTIQEGKTTEVTDLQKSEITAKIEKRITEDKDLGEIYKENENPLSAWMKQKVETTHREVVEKFIPIPKIKITDEGIEEYCFVDFDLDLSVFKHVPIQNEILIQNLEDMSDRERIKGDAIDFEGYDPKKEILTRLRLKSEIDYEKCSALLFKLITQLCDYYCDLYGNNGMQNIVMMYKQDLANQIYNQMMQHFYCENGMLVEEVVGARDYNLPQHYNFVERMNLYAQYTGNIKSILFEGIRKGVFSSAKFDSYPELKLARVLEGDKDVKNWLRPAKQEFNITYNHGHPYEPDFVVETGGKIFLIEVKGEDKINMPDVIAKKNRAIKYCEAVSRWGKANGYKEWQYLFIPSKQIQENSSFEQLAKRFREK